MLTITGPVECFYTKLVVVSARSIYNAHMSPKFICPCSEILQLQSLTLIVLNVHLLFFVVVFFR